jgi:hypothetical protein
VLGGLGKTSRKSITGHGGAHLKPELHSETLCRRKEGWKEGRKEGRKGREGKWEGEGFIKYSEGKESLGQWQDVEVMNHVI